MTALKAHTVSETNAQEGVREPELAPLGGSADRGRVGTTLGNVTYDEFARMYT